MIAFNIETSASSFIVEPNQHQKVAYSLSSFKRHRAVKGFMKAMRKRMLTIKTFFGNNCLLTHLVLGPRLFRNCWPCTICVI